MRATERQASASSVSMAFRGRSVLSIRRNQVVSMENSHDQELQELDLFHSRLADRLLSVSASAADGQEEPKNEDRNHHVLTLPFLRKLLDAFLCCEEEFRALLLGFLDRNPGILSKPPVDRLVGDLLDRAIKSLDICNAVTHALDSLNQWHTQADIAVSALQHRQASERQDLRARNALSKLIASISQDHQDSSGRSAERAWSFGRSSRCGSNKEQRPRSPSWSVSRTWSAAKQVQAMSVGLAQPRGGEASPLALAAYTMSAFIVFVMWALVAAFPFSERSGYAAALSPPTPPRQLPWAAPMVALQERIAEEWRKKEKKGGCSRSSSAAPRLLAELQRMERCGRGLVEMGESISSPEEAEQVKARAEELAETCRELEEEVGPFQRQIRVVFHRIVRSRAEVLDCLTQSSSSSPSF